jgi:3,4-dihydroxy 2-butanone 4-phosphate synthase/GTP cyclohydrolase II
MQSADQTVRNQPILKDYGIGAQILRDLGVVHMRLLGGQRKIPSITGFGLVVTDFMECPADMLVQEAQNSTAKFGNL